MHRDWTQIQLFLTFMFNRVTAGNSSPQVIYVNNIIQRSYLNSYEDVKFSLNIIGIYDIDFIDEISEEYSASYYDMYKWLEMFMDYSDWLYDNFPRFYLWDTDMMYDYNDTYTYVDIFKFKQTLGSWVYTFKSDFFANIENQSLSEWNFDFFGEDLEVFAGPLNLDMSMYDEFFKTTHRSSNYLNLYMFQDYYSEELGENNYESDNKLFVQTSVVNVFELNNVVCKSSKTILGMSSYSVNLQTTLTTMLSQDVLPKSLIDNSFPVLLSTKVRRM